MPNPIAGLVSFVIDKLDGEPISKRVEIYRALADIEPQRMERGRLLSLANELAAIERRAEQLKLDFRKKTL